MKILVIGQCTLHWGRMEFGNIGNYYIIEPFFRQLHRVFPDAQISTTFQMSEAFCLKESVEVLPMHLYYSWDNDLVQAKDELVIANRYIEDGTLERTTPYIDVVKDMDLVIDFSGDIWGDNADFLGEDRFMVGLLKDRVAQLLAKKTVMLAGSPGPFNSKKNIDFAKEVYANFDLVTNRESISIQLLEENGFDTSKTKSLTCPAFLFEPTDLKNLLKFDALEAIVAKDRKSVGFLICGWNFTIGPFDKWPRDDSEYLVFAEAIEAFTNNYDVDVYLMSHSNGFPIPPKQFELQHGRDYPIIKQLQKVLLERANCRNVYALDGVYSAWETKRILGAFDMVVSGRVHAAVAAMSQCVPTVVIDYGHEPKAHKLRGFAQVAGQDAYVAHPDEKDSLQTKMNTVWDNRESIHNDLVEKIPKVKALGKTHFDLLKQICL